MTKNDPGDKHRSIFIDHNTEASLSGRVRCNILKHAFHYPARPLVFLVSQISAFYFFNMASSSWGVPLIVMFALIYMYYKHISAVCWQGDLCAAKVVSVSPLRIAVFTDLSQHGNPYPVIKIMKPPFMTFGFCKPEIGDRLATVALYQQSEKYVQRWADFTPRPVQCITFSKSKIELTTERITQDLWDDLEVNLDLIADRTETIGLYHQDKLIG